MAGICTVDIVEVHGRPKILLAFDGKYLVKLTMPLNDAETLAEALIAQVRRAEATAAPKP